MTVWCSETESPAADQVSPDGNSGPGEPVFRRVHNPGDPGAGGEPGHWGKQITSATPQDYNYHGRIHSCNVNHPSNVLCGIAKICNDLKGKDQTIAFVEKFTRQA